MRENSIEWQRIVISAVISGLITILTGAVLFRLQAREPKLIYEVIDSNLFEGADRNIGIFGVSIVNAGGKPVTDLRGVIQIRRATLLDVKLVAEPTLQHSHEIKGDTLEFRAEELSQNDRITISLLASSDNTLPRSPQVFVRGEGITGVGASPWTHNGLLHCWLPWRRR